MKTQVTAAIVAPNSITLVVDGQTTPISDSHPNYDEIRQHASAGAYSKIDALIDLVKAVVDFGEGRVTVENGQVLYDGEQTHNAVTSRILQMVDEGLEVGPMIAFLDNLMKNPSYRSVQQLYQFLEVNDLPITEDGYFLAYRMCRSDWTDNRTGEMDNSIGAVVSMPRNKVNEDPTQTCSAGLHVCAQGYLGFYGGNGRTLLVKVNPEHVVAVPNDYNNAKMRVCEFTVMSEVKSDTRGDVHTSAVYKPSAVAQNTLASAEDILTRDEAIIRLGLQACQDPKAALRKRLTRGTTAKEVFVDGVAMVQIIDGDNDVEVADDSVMTHAEAIDHFAEQNRIDGRDQPSNAKAALRKRLNRGTTAKRVYVDGTEMVKILNDD